MFYKKGEKPFSGFSFFLLQNQKKLAQGIDFYKKDSYIYTIKLNNHFSSK